MLGRRTLGLAVILTAFSVAPIIAAPPAPRCMFGECEDGKPNPEPARPTPVEPERPPVAALPKPQATAAARPSSPGEVCHVRAGITYCASSVLKPQHGFTYGPENLLDNNLSTAWVEGVAGQGEGEWLVIAMQADRSLRRIELLNGYHKNQSLFERNGRVSKLEVRLSDGTSKMVQLKDSGGVQIIEFNGNKKYRWVQLIIRSTYKGTKYSDTAISELRVVTQE